MQITDVQFETLAERPHPAWVIRVKVLGGVFPMRAAPFRATVGELEVEGLTPLLDTYGIAGYLTEEPPIGAELSIGYMDQELVDTGFTYQPPVSNGGA